MLLGKITANVKKTIYYLQRNGLKNMLYAAMERLEDTAKNSYVYSEPSAKELELQRSTKFPQEPLFSILVPLYRTPEVYLKELLDSVQDQTYGKWELVLADATEDDSVKKILEAYMEDDRRIRYLRLSENGGISVNTNEGLKAVTGDYVGLLDHDDVLTPDALFYMAKAIHDAKEQGICLKILYSDEDKCDADRSTYYEPHHKTDFNLDLLLSNNYICHFLVMKRELITGLGFRKEYDGAQDYDLVLRGVSAVLPGEEQIAHIPRVLYHWRCHVGSTAQNPQSKQYAYEAGKRALEDMAAREEYHASAEHLKHLGFYRLVYKQEIWEARRDVGVVGGRMLNRGRIAAGAYAEDGTILYQGLKNGYSGYMHRAVLAQNAAAVDVRMMKVRPECRDLLCNLTGIPYQERQDGTFDWTILPGGTDYVALSLQFGKILRQEGYRILWDPMWTGKLPH